MAASDSDVANGWERMQRDIHRSIARGASDPCPCAYPLSLFTWLHSLLKGAPLPFRLWPVIAWQFFAEANFMHAVGGPT